MKPETTGPDLLDAAAQVLADDLATGLSGEARFKALMAASAVRMAARQWRAAAELSNAAAPLGGTEQGTLAFAIRSGAHDGDTQLHAALIADAQARTSVSKPSAV
jgi:hypothetical protein